MSSAPSGTAFALEELRLHNGASLTGQNPLTVVTPAGRWNYALSFPRVAGLVGTEQAWLIAVEVKVLRGSVGVGCIRADGSTYLDESIVAETEQLQEVLLFVARMDRCAEVVLRNAEQDGAPCVVQIHRIDASPLDPSRYGVRPRYPDLQPVPGWNAYYAERLSDLDDKIRAWRYQNFTRPVVADWINGLRIWIYPDNEMSRAVYVSGVYEPNTMLALLRLLPPGGVMLDVGANMGFFSLLAADAVGHGGRVYALEPSPREFSRLERNVALSGLENIVCVEAAITAASGTAELNIATNQHAGHNTLGSPPAGSQETVRVPSISIDEFADREALQRLDVVKLDVEGSEVMALSGAEHILERLRPKVILEVSPQALQSTGASVQDLQSVLDRHRYSPHLIDEETAQLIPTSDIPVSRPQNIVAIPR